MGGLNYMSSELVNADTAGHTGGSSEPTAAPTSPTEAMHGLFATEVGRLGFLFGHTQLQAVSTDLEQATTSVRGPLGGLVPRIRERLTPYPPVVDGNNNLEAASTIVPRFTDTVRHELDRARRLFFGA